MKNSHKNKKRNNLAVYAAKVMDQRQYAAFLVYYGLGGERSIENLHRHWTEILPNLKRPHIHTIKLWSGKFNWQNEVKKMDNEANAKLYDEAMNAAKDARVDILKLFRAVVLRFATQLKDDPSKPITSFDIFSFWRMSRVEMGLTTESNKQIHELGDSFFDLMRMRHAKRIQPNEQNRLSAPGQGDVVDSE